MKTKLRSIVALACASVCALSFTACSAGRSKLLGAPKAVESLDYETLVSDGYKSFENSVKNFAAEFAGYAYADYKKQQNFAVSPISVYMALSLAAECASGDTRSEILDALGVTYDQLKTYFSTLYARIESEEKRGDDIMSVVKLSNSIWVNDGTKVKQRCIDALSNNYYAYSYSADFKHDNAGANKAVRNFVKEQTRGLIDKDYNLSADTLFTLISALYLKEVWDEDGDDLPFATDRYDFTEKDGTVKNIRLLQGGYCGGRVAEFDTYTTFFTYTEHGYSIDFILPKDGYTVDEVFTAENIATVSALSDYNRFDEEANTCYYTRTLFPEYKCSYDEDIIKILRDGFDIKRLFGTDCDVSSLTDANAYCNQVRHTTNLTVNKKGIEGAAATQFGWAGSAAGPEDPPIIIYEEYVIDKAFGFIISGYNDVALFSGVVNNV